MEDSKAFAWTDPASFTWSDATAFADEWQPLASAILAGYVPAVLLLNFLMKFSKPFDLSLPLKLWNFTLSALSLYGFSVLFQRLFYIDFIHSITSWDYSSGQTGFGKMLLNALASNCRINVSLLSFNDIFCQFFCRVSITWTIQSICGFIWQLYQLSHPYLFHQRQHPYLWLCSVFWHWFMLFT